MVGAWEMEDSTCWGEGGVCEPRFQKTPAFNHSSTFTALGETAVEFEHSYQVAFTRLTSSNLKKKKIKKNK
jgi:hypothetical protein